MRTTTRRWSGLIFTAVGLTGCPDEVAVTTSTASDGTQTTTSSAADDSSPTTTQPPTTGPTDPPATTTTPDTTGNIGDTTGPVDTTTGESTDTGSTTTAPSNSTSTTDTGDTTDTTTGDTTDTTSDVPGVCGDGELDPGETCDDGPANADDAACTGQCQTAGCGDGHLYAGVEQCDDGVFNGPGMTCNAMCELNVCGDGDQGPGEQCDDGAGNGPGKACNLQCKLNVCGDGVVGPNEACDDFKDGDPDDGCTDKCQKPACGDGYVQDSLGELCDDGNKNNADGCLDTCTSSTCGDGVVQPTEQCDDGNLGPGDTCSKVCAATKVAQIAMGNDHTCVRFASGRLRCWGRSTQGECGYGTTLTYGDAPGELPTADVPLGKKTTHVDAGEHFTCVQIDGNVHCFGDNATGQLGIGSELDVGDMPGELLPPQVKLGAVDPVTFASGGYHSCALFPGGTVRCWGNGSQGALGYENENDLGDGPGDLPTTTVKLGEPMSQLSVGSGLSCAVHYTDEDYNYALCWGDNTYGKLGAGAQGDSIGDSTNDMPPDPVNLGAGTVVSVTAGNNHACAIMAGGKLRCWGSNSHGQLGQGNTVDNDLSVPAADLAIGGAAKQVALGQAHTCVLLDTGKVRCWGRNLFGALGYADNLDRGDQPGEMPTPFVDLGGEAVMLAAGFFKTCALLVDGTMRCWGEHGAYGYGSTAHIGDDEVPAAAGPVPF